MFYFHPMETSFGSFNGTPVREYILQNAAGMQVGILNYGATITRIIVPDRNGVSGDVVLGFDTMEGYLQKDNPYFGATIGRYANRIANAQFTLDGKAYPLAVNNGVNSLHGGWQGFDKVIWDVKHADNNSLALLYVSKDGEEGYPGTLTSEVRFTVTEENEIVINYTATSDKATPVNLTNHSYFNLSAGVEPTILKHSLWLKANQYTEVNDKLIPTGRVLDVKGTPLDFTEEKEVGRDINRIEGGYDHNMVLQKEAGSLSMVATVYDPQSGRFMEMYTTEPGVQLYTSNFLDGALQFTKHNQVYNVHAALCLEAQHFPDSPNQPGFPSVILKPGETYLQTTVYRFSVKE